MALPLLVFVSGAAVMVLEIVSSRFFAPYIGTSIFVWTSLIGVVMAGLSIGYALGGLLGDRWRSFLRLRLIVGGAAMWILLLTLLRDPVLSSLAVALPSLLTVAVLGALCLLVVPSVLLGMVSPYAVRLVARDVAHVGRVAGMLAALSTVGSIVGVFLAGFALIPSLGTDAILRATAALLLLVVVFPVDTRSILVGVGVLLAITGMGRLTERVRAAAHARDDVLAHVDSPYSVLRVERIPDPHSGRAILLLAVDRGSHAAVFEEGKENVLRYVPYFRLVDAVREDVSKALLLGGGGYSTARDFLSRHPESSLDVVEIDPVVTDLARQYFGLTEEGRMTIVHEDARTFLNRAGPPGGPGKSRGLYQVVFGDVFQSLLTIPFHLTTREAAQRVWALLDDRGVYLANVIASRQGPRNTFLRAELRTLRAVFPSVLLFDVPTGRPEVDGDLTQYRNVILLASKVPLAPGDLQARGHEDLAEMLHRRVEDPSDLTSVPVLTDDYAPVEAMLNL